MAKIKTVPVKVKGIALFTSLATPRKFEDKSQPKYELTLKITREEYDRIENMAMDLAIEQFGEKKARRANLPLWTGDPKKDPDETPYFKCSNKNPVVCYGPDKNEITPDKVFDGAEVTIIAALWAQDNEYGCRINAFLNGVRWNGGGTKIESRKKVTADDFDDDVSETLLTDSNTSDEDVPF